MLRHGFLALVGACLIACTTSATAVDAGPSVVTRADAGGGGQVPGPPPALVATVSDVSEPFPAQGGFTVREVGGQAGYELSIYGSRRNPATGEPAPLTFQTPLTRDELRNLLMGGTVQRPDTPVSGAVSYSFPGGSDPLHTTVSRWMRTITLVWNSDATVTLRATLGPVFRYEDGTTRATEAAAVAEIHGIPQVQCTITGPVPNTLMYDTRFESPFCRGALNDTGLSRLVSLSGTPMP